MTYSLSGLFIDGAWRTGEGRVTEPVLDPATGAVLAGNKVAGGG